MKLFILSFLFLTHAARADIFSISASTGECNETADVNMTRIKLQQLGRTFCPQDTSYMLRLQSEVITEKNLHLTCESGVSTPIKTIEIQSKFRCFKNDETFIFSGRSYIDFDDAQEQIINAAKNNCLEANGFVFSARQIGDFQNTSDFRHSWAFYSSTARFQCFR